jgi:two-component system sensor histidine kinase CreC
MKLTIGVKLFIAYFVITSSIVWFVTDKVSFRITNGIDQAAEEVMIDSANLLAQIVSSNVQDNEINVDKIRGVISAYLDRETNANVYSINKKKPNLQVYITNKDGIVIYDSQGRVEGKDYSQWRDVFLTLKGEYGARSSAYDASITDPTP